MTASGIKQFLSTPRCLFVAESSTAAGDVAAFFCYGVLLSHPVQVLNQKMLEVFEHGEKHASFAHEVQAFVQATQISKPVEETVHISVDLVKVQV